MTGLERTLIDITVRPGYAGGVEQVVEAYRRARDRASVAVIVKTLEKLDFIYPYHQAIGFYLELAGYPSKEFSALKALGMPLDFYLAHNMRDPAYNKVWKLYHPKGL